MTWPDVIRDSHALHCETLFHVDPRSFQQLLVSTSPYVAKS
jgi:hypothetical protein